MRVQGSEDLLTAHVTCEGFEDPLTALEKMGVFRGSVKMALDIKGAKTGLTALVAPGATDDQGGPPGCRAGRLSFVPCPGGLFQPAQRPSPCRGYPAGRRSGSLRSPAPDH